MTTWSDIYSVLMKTLNASLPRLRSIDDWLEIGTFRVRQAYEYEEIQRYTLRQGLSVATIMGDPKLGWLDLLLMENRQALSYLGAQNQLSWFKQLHELRESVPAFDRSDQTLTAKALDILLSNELENKARRILTEEANNAVRLAIIAAVTRQAVEGPQSPLREDIDVATRSLQKGLLEYLYYRGEAGFQLRIENERWEAFAGLAVGHGFTIQNLGQAADGFVLFKLKKQSSRLEEMDKEN